MTHFQDQDQVFTDLRAKEAAELAQILATRYGLPYVDLSRVILDNSAVRLIPEALAREAKAVVYHLHQKSVQMAIQTPNNEKVSPLVEELTRQGYAVSLFIASEFEIAKTWEMYKEVSYAKPEEAGSISGANETREHDVSLIKTSADVKAPVSQAAGAGDIHALSTVVEIILGGAIATGVSDVHIEPEKNIVRVRFRLDGVLQDVVELGHAEYKKILSRIKLLAGMKLNLTHEAQDGRFTIDRKSTRLNSIHSSIS